jgi:hypothetical protein
MENIFLGSHTYDVLANAMTEVHSRFHLEGKVVRTTTDNGSNFVKAFTQFSSEPILLPQLTVPPAPTDRDEETLLALTEELSVNEGPTDTNSGELDFENNTIEEVLEMEAFETDILPPHMRCAAHTLNLVASADAEKALMDQGFKSIYRRTMAKAQGLWNAQSRSIPTADLIQEVLGKRLIVPNTTRWNSTFDSVTALNKFLDTNRKDGCIFSPTDKMITSFSFLI